MKLYTNLSVNECRRRLEASESSEPPRPGKWQPSKGDPEVFRRVRGNSFDLSIRGTPANGPRDVSGQVSTAVPAQEIHPSASFKGRLRPHGTGTVITGRSGMGIVTGVTTVLIIGYLALATYSAVYHDGRLTLRDTVFVGMMLLAGLILLLGRSMLERKLAPKSDPYIVSFLERYLEASHHPSGDSR